MKGYCWSSLQRLMDKPQSSHRPVLFKLMMLCKWHQREMSITPGEVPELHVGTRPWSIEEAFTVLIRTAGQRKHFQFNCTVYHNADNLFKSTCVLTRTKEAGKSKTEPHTTSPFWMQPIGPESILLERLHTWHVSSRLNKPGQVHLQ